METNEINFILAMLFILAFMVTLDRIAAKQKKDKHKNKRAYKHKNKHA